MPRAAGRQSPAAPRGASAFRLRCIPCDTASFHYCLRFRKSPTLIPGTFCLSCKFIPYYIKERGKTQDICRILENQKNFKKGLAFLEFIAYNTKRTIHLIYSITERKLCLYEHQSRHQWFWPHRPHGPALQPAAPRDRDRGHQRPVSRRLPGLYAEV